MGGRPLRVSHRWLRLATFEREDALLSANGRGPCAHGRGDRARQTPYGTPPASGRCPHPASIGAEDSRALRGRGLRVPDQERHADDDVQLEERLLDPVQEHRPRRRLDHLRTAALVRLVGVRPVRRPGQGRRPRRARRHEDDGGPSALGPAGAPARCRTVERTIGASPGHGLSGDSEPTVWGVRCRRSGTVDVRRPSHPTGVCGWIRDDPGARVW